MNKHKVILSGFADEASFHKTAIEQFSAFAAMGLQHFTLRFIDIGSGIKNVMELSPSEIDKLCTLKSEYGLQVASIGSPIGKVKLLDVEDGTSNRYVPFESYLDQVKTACQRAHSFGTKLLRGFSFYPPRDDRPEAHLAAASDRIGRIADVCQTEGVVLGLEVEANLVGRTGELLAQIYQQVDSPALKLIFDAANLLVQGFSVEQTIAQYHAMKPGLGWLHIKDYKPQQRDSQGAYVDEDSLSEFVPVSRGSGVHDVVLADLANELPQLTQTMKYLGAPGFVLDLEPHLKGGGQFGGFSGPDGMGVALRALCNLLDQFDIGYDLRS